LDASGHDELLVLLGMLLALVLGGLGFWKPLRLEPRAGACGLFGGGCWPITQRSSGAGQISGESVKEIFLVGFSLQIAWRAANAHSLMFALGCQPDSTVERNTVFLPDRYLSACARPAAVF